VVGLDPDAGLIAALLPKCPARPCALIYATSAWRWLGWELDGG
jgi:hypothetical protein